jgi:hypothetical protein
MATARRTRTRTKRTGWWTIPRAQADLRRAYDRFNRKYFASRLPSGNDISVRLIPFGNVTEALEPADLGATYVSEKAEDDRHPIIEVRFNEDREFRMLTLLHEMSHLSAGINNGHGRKWKAEIRRISRLGAMIEVV